MLFSIVLLTQNRVCRRNAFRYLLPCRTLSYHIIVHIATKYRASRQKLRIPSFYTDEWKGTEFLFVMLYGVAVKVLHANLPLPAEACV